MEANREAAAVGDDVWKNLEVWTSSWRKEVGFPPAERCGRREITGRQNPGLQQVW